MNTFNTTQNALDKQAWKMALTGLGMKLFCITLVTLTFYFFFSSGETFFSIGQEHMLHLILAVTAISFVFYIKQKKEYFKKMLTEDGACEWSSPITLNAYYSFFHGEEVIIYENKDGTYTLRYINATHFRAFPSLQNAKIAAPAFCEKVYNHMHTLAFSPDPKPLQEQVGQWADKAFPHSDDRAKIEHIRDEIDELNAAPSDPFEAADIFLIMLHLAYSKNYDLEGKARLIENIDHAGNTVFEAIQYIQKQFKELQANPDNLKHALVGIVTGLLKIAEIMGYDLFQVAKEKFALVQERVYGEPDDRGVCHHVVKAAVENA